MSSTPEQLSIPRMLAFRDRFEMGDGLFEEITGIPVAALFAYRRGRTKARPRPATTAHARIMRCEELLHFATELTGDEEKGLDWIYADSPSFSGQSPIDATVSEKSMEKVRAYIAALRAAVAQPGHPQQSQCSPRVEPSPDRMLVPPPRLSPVAPIGAAQKTPESLAAKSTPTDAQTPSTPNQATPAERGGQVAPPAGITANARVFRLKEPLSKIRASRPKLTLKRISQMMADRGHEQFASSSYMSRLANSYTWATWEEVLALSDALAVDPRELGSVYSAL